MIPHLFIIFCIHQASQTSCRLLGVTGLFPFMGTALTVKRVFAEAGETPFGGTSFQRPAALFADGVVLNRQPRNSGFGVFFALKRLDDSFRVSGGGIDQSMRPGAFHFSKTFASDARPLEDQIQSSFRLLYPAS